MQTVRAFIAIHLPNDARAAISTLQSRLKALVPPHSVRWTVPQNIHLTLHFLGDVTVADLEETARALGAATTSAFPLSLTLANLGCFPNTRRPRIVWVGVAGETEGLVNLHQALGDQLKQRIGFEPETRPYSPHLTIGRVKKGIPRRRLTQLGDVLEQEQLNAGLLAKLVVSEIRLMQSDLKPDGPVYTSLAQVQLKGL